MRASELPMEETKELASYEQVQARIDKDFVQLTELWKAMRKELEKVGLSESLPERMPEFGHAELKRDDFDGSDSLYAEWRKEKQMIGNVIIHNNATAFAEYDVVLAHPSKKSWFIEAVTAWSSNGKVQAELRLLPAL